MNNTGMELPGAPFLYTMGIIGMTFIGFSAIVMLLRQTSGLALSPSMLYLRMCIWSLG